MIPDLGKRINLLIQLHVTWEHSSTETLTKNNSPAPPAIGPEKEVNCSR